MVPFEGNCLPLLHVGVRRNNMGETIISNEGIKERSFWPIDSVKVINCHISVLIWTNVSVEGRTNVWS